MKYNELKSMLAEKKVTIADFCEQLQITRQGLQKSLDNDLLPTNKVMQACRILNITPNDFFCWNESATEGSNYNLHIEEPLPNDKLKSNPDLSSLMNILSRFLMNQEQQQEIMKDMVSIYKRINNK